jgi:tight adherence protein B
VLALGLLLGLAGWWCCDALVVVPLAVVLVMWTRGRTRHGRAMRAAARRRREVVEVCAVLRTELVAGRSSTAALIEASAACPATAGVGESSRYGGEPVTALRRAAEHAGNEGLRALAACWQVASKSGIGLVPAVTRVEHALREELRDRAELEAELGGVRATASLLAGLPLLAIGLGGIAGGDPLRILLHTIVGAFCLVSGVLLELAGVTWVDRIATRALRSAGGVGP